MTFIAPSASALSPRPMPVAPTVDALAEQFPHLLRPLYAQALAWAETQSLALRACACAMLWSLVHEDFPAREDARIVASRLAAVLGRPQLGLEMLSGEKPASKTHEHAIELGEQALRRIEGRPLQSWPKALATIASAVVERLYTSAAPWLGIGPSAALSVLYGPFNSLFSPAIVHPDALRERFEGRFPRTCVLAEPDLEASETAQLLRAYGALSFDEVICVSGSAHLTDLRGFRRAVHSFEVPEQEALTLAHASYIHAASFSSIEDAWQPRTLRRITMHVWERVV